MTGGSIHTRQCVHSEATARSRPLLGGSRPRTRLLAQAAARPDEWLADSAQEAQERVQRQLEKLQEASAQAADAASQHAALLQELGTESGRWVLGATVAERERLQHIAGIAQQRMQERARFRGRLDPQVMALRGGLGRMSVLVQETQSRIEQQYAEAPELFKELLEEFREEQAMKEREQRRQTNTPEHGRSGDGPSPQSRAEPAGAREGQGGQAPARAGPSAPAEAASAAGAPRSGETAAPASAPSSRAAPTEMPAARAGYAAQAQSQPQAQPQTSQLRPNPSEQPIGPSSSAPPATATAAAAPAAAAAQPRPQPIQNIPSQPPTSSTTAGYSTASNGYTTQGQGQGQALGQAQMGPSQWAPPSVPLQPPTSPGNGMPAQWAGRDAYAQQQGYVGSMPVASWPYAPVAPRQSAQGRWAQPPPPPPQGAAARDVYPPAVPPPQGAYPDGGARRGPRWRVSWPWSRSPPSQSYPQEPWSQYQPQSQQQPWPPSQQSWPGYSPAYGQAQSLVQGWSRDAPAEVPVPPTTGEPQSLSTPLTPRDPSVVARPAVGPERPAQAGVPQQPPLPPPSGFSAGPGVGVDASAGVSVGGGFPWASNPQWPGSAPRVPSESEWQEMDARAAGWAIAQPRPKPKANRWLHQRAQGLR